jgi:hypothetical protein
MADGLVSVALNTLDLPKLPTDAAPTSHSL